MKLSTKNKKIQSKNLTFQKSTNAEKRVLIAKDVLAQIKAKRYIPTAQVWAIFDDKDFTWGSYKEFGFTGDESVQELFKKEKLKTCECCALGSLFVSCINLNNTTTIKHLQEETSGLSSKIQSEERLSNNLNHIFSKNQLLLIEEYFEGENAATLESYEYASDDALDFIDKYSDDKIRLQLIMENIIKNKGTFVPSKLP